MTLFFIIFFGAIGLDLITKYWAETIFRLSEVTIIPNVLYFTYLENRGAAFGILQNQRWFFIIITFLVILGIFIYLLMKKPKSSLLLYSLAMIAGGGVGNLIDRVFLSYVRDFIDFRLINFPVFNIADSFVVIGSILLCIVILMEEKDVKKP